MGRCLLLLGVMALTVAVLSQSRRKPLDRPASPEGNPFGPTKKSENLSRALVGPSPKLPLLRFPGPSYHVCLSVN
jgi:hypothetical protein